MKLHRSGSFHDPFFERAARPVSLAAHPTPPGCADIAALSLSSECDRAAFSQSDKVVIGIDLSSKPDTHVYFVRLSDHAMILVRAIAAYEQCPEETAIAIALATHVTKIGAGPLARAVLDAEARCTADYEVVDLTDVPEFERSGKTRFRSGGP